jgi:hypothetical protein
MSKEKSNLSLLTLLPGHSGHSGQGNICRSGKFGIETLSNNSIIKRVSGKEEYIGKDLIKSIEYGRKKRLQVMINCYNNCCKKIKEADKDNEQYIFFTVPTSVPGCPKYNPVVILEYISENLRNKFIDTLILDNGETIYINWENLEINIENSKEKESND